MLTPYGELAAGTHEVGDRIVTVNANGYTDSPKTTETVRFVSPFDFRKLFTQAERIAIYGSADGIVKDFMGALQTITTHVDLQDPQTVQAVGYLAMIGLIAPERVQQILSGQAQE